VTLSPKAAASHWVNKEISYWLEHRGRDQLMVAMAAGQLRWDEANECFDPQASDAAPPVLTEPGSLPAEPLFTTSAETRRGTTAHRRAVAYTPDGQTIASTGEDGTMRLSNARTGAALNPKPERVGALNSLAILPGGEAVVTVGDDNNIRLWDPGNGKQFATRKVSPTTRHSRT
jgi:WD40 repeat protein